MSEKLLFCGIARLFSLSDNDVVILVSYNRFSVSFNLKHYQISKGLSYLHLYKRLLSLFREAVILEELLFAKWTINDLNAA